MIPEILGFERVWPYLAAALLGGYLAGAVPFGLLISRVFGLGDVRRIGSGNIGATNVLRTGNRIAAAITVLLDAAKGLLPTLLASEWGPLTAALAAAGAVVGHCLPIWLRFRGGKGVATAVGALLILNWTVALLALAIWLAVVLTTRFVSLASLVACLAAPVLMAVYQEWDMLPATVLMAGLVVARHAANIRRLLRGEEPRIRLRRGS